MLWYANYRERKILLFKNLIKFMNIFKNQKEFKNKPNKIDTLRTTQQAFLVSAVKWTLFMADFGWTRL